ncbi:MAG: hypothetical protein K1X78_04060 [Verrucomicrobiaceae bacterium]|nr:hypothetical protein [Verrucomicrobiaceae bacterium]
MPPANTLSATSQPEQERFDHYLIARNRDGQPIQLSRSSDESAFLAFDLHSRRLVELHVIHGGHNDDPARRRSSYERAVQAGELRGGSFPRILEVGEDDGLVYYSSTLNDGEFVEDYIARRGALPPATAFCMLLQLLEDLVPLQSYHRLVSRLRLNRLLVTALEDTFLHLRAYDYGLAEKEQRSDGDHKRLAAEVCELIFLLLTGKTYGGDNPDRYPALTCLPSGLRTTLRTVLPDKSQAPSTLEKLRDDVREAFAALVSNLQTRSTRKHVVVTNENALPKSQLQDLLLESIPLDALLTGRFTVENADIARRYPFSIPARNLKNDQPVTVHLLPPSRIVPKDHYEAVPLQMWRFDPQKHPNILRSLSVWENPDWTFLTEEREGGFALSRLIAERITLNPAEVLVLLKQVRDGIGQALECGVQRVDLHPSNMVLLLAKAATMQQREFDRLMQKRIDAWPPFKLKLRPHLTMRSLYEPLLADLPSMGAQHDQDFRSRSFVALAAYMLTGERLSGRSIEFPETVPQPLAQYIASALELARTPDATPTPDEFLAGFEKLAATSDQSGLDAGFLRGPAVAHADMESAGSVSDFDEDAGDTGQAPAFVPSKYQPRAFGIGREPPKKKRAAAILIWGGVAAALIVTIVALTAGDSSPPATQDGTNAVASADGAPANASGAQPAKPQGAAKKMLIMIRKAIIPTREEIDDLRRKQAEALKTEREAAMKPEGKLAERSSAQ